LLGPVFTVTSPNSNGRIVDANEVDGDTSVIPSPWHDAVIHFAAFYGFQALDDTRAKIEFEAGEIRVEDMTRNYGPDLGRHRVMQTVDGGSGGELQWALPSDFGPEVP